MTSPRSLRTPTWSIVALAFLAGAGATAFGVWEGGGWTKDGAVLAARYTARIGLPVFLLAWSAAAMARLFPGGWRAILLRRRRAIGLAFAATHTIHLLALTTASLAFGEPTSLLGIVGGSVGYVFVFAMALTSTDAAVRRLGARRWRLLHASGGYVLAGIFAFSYYGRLERDPPLALVTLALIAAAVVLRVAAWAKARLAAGRVSPA